MYVKCIGSQKDKCIFATATNSWGEEIMENKKKKRIVIKRNIPKEVIPLNEQTWLLQPVAVTAMRYNYDVTQTKILVNIIQEMQEAIRDEWLNHKKPETQLQLFQNQEFADKFGTEGFNPEEEIILKMAYSDCGCDPRRYNELVQALEGLATTPVHIPLKDVNGKEYTEIGSLCSVVFPNQARGKYERHFYVKMKKTVASRMLNIEMGVHKYLKDVVFNTKNRYVQRLYMYISSWRDKEYCTISVDQLRKMLRLENMYKRWSAFYSDVVLDAQKELKEKADAGQVDLYFIPEKIYKNGKKCGEPQEIRFYLFKSQAGEVYDEVIGFKSRKIKAGDFIKEKWHIVGTDLKTILSRITPDNVDRLATFLTALEPVIRQRVSEGALQTEKQHVYVYRCITNEMDKWEREEALKTEAGKQSQPVTVQYATTDEPQSPQASLLSQSDMQSWQQFLHEASQVFSEEVFSTWIEPIVPHVVTPDGVIRLGVPNEVFYNIVKENYEALYLPVLLRVFGKNMRVQYVKLNAEQMAAWNEEKIV